MKTLVLIAALVAAALVPSALASPRTGAVHVTKECSGFTGDEGSFCAITASNVPAIEVGSHVVYLQPALVDTPAGSDVVLDPPGPGANQAYGHCSTATNVCTFRGGTGKFTWFHASIAVSYIGGLSYAWDGAYSFEPQG